MRFDIIVIGGGPAGIISAITARKYNKDKKILIVKSIENGIIPCGIPYMFNSLQKPEDNIMRNESLEKNNIELIIDEVKNIDKENKKITTKNNEIIDYDKLILATGSKPINPKIKGIEKKGIYGIEKELQHLNNLNDDIKKAKDIVIIGGGFIGVEFADELSEIEGKNISIIESNQDILMNSFDKEFSSLANNILNNKRIKLLTNKKAEAFNGDERVTSVMLSDGSEIPCQVVILGMGAFPNTNIAENVGIEIGKSKGIIVDEYLRTSEKDIFAVGDCAEKKDYFTRKRISVMLASTACAEARIAGSNLYGIKLIRENKGTIATYSTKIGELVLGSAGLTESTAIMEGFDILVGNAECVDKHPGKLHNANKVNIKLVFSKQSSILLGGQVAGGDSAGELINIISLAIQKNTLLSEFETLQLATHPKLTAAPTVYPLITAAQNALLKTL
jgi:NADH oxidase (H2O2-forming)